MAYLNDRVLDRGLEALVAETTRLALHATEPADYEEADGSALGSKVGVAVVGPAAAASGRRATVGPISDGVVDTSGSAAFWSLLDDNNERLLASAPLSNVLAIASGNAFTLTAFDITFPGVEAEA